MQVAHGIVRASADGDRPRGKERGHRGQGLVRGRRGLDAQADRRRPDADRRTDADARAEAGREGEDDEARAECGTERDAERESERICTEPVAVAAVGADLAVGHRGCGSTVAVAVPVECAERIPERVAEQHAAGHPVAVAPAVNK